MTSVLPSRIRRSLVLAALAAAVVSGCGRAPATAAADGAALDGGFSVLDLDADGRLDRSEAAMPGFAFDAADTDRDGGLSFFEWNAQRDNADTAMRIQLQRETVRDTADGLRAGTALPTNRGASGLR